MKYYPGLDGLRGVAVLCVMMTHFGLTVWGWLGVQSFFVLSGFLVTEILMDDRTASFGSYLRQFYIRRTLRIFPLYFGYLLLLAVYRHFTGEPSSFAEDAPLLFSYTYNFTHLFADWKFVPHYTHFWSLSVEEQFYLIWPFVIYWLGPRRLKWCLAVLFIGAPLSRLALGALLQGWGRQPFETGDAVYWFTFCQMDAFAAGAAVVLLKDRLKNPSVGLIIFLGLAIGLGLANFYPSPLTLYEWLKSLGYPLASIRNAAHVWSYPVWNFVFFFLILTLIQKEKKSWLHVVFSNPLARGLGKISYGMYVFHMAVFILFKRWFQIPGFPGSLAFFAAYFGGVAAVAALSYRYYELPFLRLKDVFAPAGGRVKSLKISTAGA